MTPRFPPSLPEAPFSAAPPAVDQHGYAYRGVGAVARVTLADSSWKTRSRRRQNSEGRRREEPGEVAGLEKVSSHEIRVIPRTTKHSCPSFPVKLTFCSFTHRYELTYLSQSCRFYMFNGAFEKFIHGPEESGLGDLPKPFPTDSHRSLSLKVTF